jgi:hypothetical protein
MDTVFPNRPGGSNGKAGWWRSVFQVAEVIINVRRKEKGVDVIKRPKVAYGMSIDVLDYDYTSMSRFGYCRDVVQLLVSYTPSLWYLLTCHQMTLAFAIPGVNFPSSGSLNLLAANVQALDCD